jgi:glycosyltransferase involved in cell wall biosynthesis
MRIVIDMQGAQTESRFRGIGRYTLSLAQAIVRNRGEHEIVLALSGLFPDTIEPMRAVFNDLLPQENIRVWYAPGPVRECDPGNEWRREVAEHIREAFLASLRPDLVFLCSLFEGYCDDAVTSIGVFAPHIPTAVVLYDLIPLLNPGVYLHANPAYAKNYQRKIEHLKQAKLWLAISESAACEGRSALAFPADKVVNISTACDAVFRRMEIAEPEKRQLLDRFGIIQPFILYSGGADGRKNLHRLIRSYAQLPKPLRATHQLVLAGRMPEGEVSVLRSTAKSVGIRDDHLIFTGYINDEDLARFYNLCTVFVFPSLHEGFGLPALEAMSCGAAVIGSNTTSIPEVIRRQDAMFDPYDEDSICQKLIQTLSDSAFRVELVTHGLEQAKKFSWDQSATRAIEAFERFYAERESIKPPVHVPGRRLKLAYVSPLPPERSGIADYSVELLSELAKHYDIEVVVDQQHVSDAWIQANCPIRDSDWLRANAHRMDRVLYHFGNSPFHQHMLDLVEEVPGTVVLHDFFLSSLRGHLEFERIAELKWARELYHAHGYLAIQERCRAGNWADTLNVVMKYPVNLQVLQHAQGVIVHSEYSRRLAGEWYEKDFAADWRMIHHLRTASDGRDRAKSREALGLNANDFVICSFGFLDSTKLNHRLMEAWLFSRLAQDDRCVLVFVGENHGGEYGKQLLKTICASGHGNRIRITGWADMPAFRNYLAAADIAVQLRTLSRGETSGTVLDCMNHSLPVIVNANGSMADLPPDAVWMLPDAFDNDQLIEALETLWQEGARRIALGEKGREVILTHHAPHACADQYAEAIEQFYAYAQSGVRSLVNSIADLDGHSPKKTECQALAQAIAKTLPVKQTSRQLLLDISATCRTDLKTGIERVARAIILSLLDSPPPGYRVEPVYLSDEGGAWHYRYARRYTLELLGCPPGVLVDEAADPHNGDVLLGLDNSGNMLVEGGKALVHARFRNVGVAVHFVVFDLLPVQRPEFFPPSSDISHAQWLRTLSTFDGAVCISKAVADDLSLWLNGLPSDRRLRVNWFHLGADVENSAPTCGLPHDAGEILTQINMRSGFLMVGTIEPRKGILQTIEAFTQLWQTGIDVNLIIVGKEGWKGLPEDMRRTIPEIVHRMQTHPELNKRLFWLEGISDEYLEKVYASSTCLIAASEGEGFGLPLIEAAQHKLPIIARDIPVFREVAGDHAFYFKGLESQNLSEAINNWLALNAKGKAPQSTDMPWLTWRQSAQQLLDAVLGEKTAPRPAEVQSADSSPQEAQDVLQADDVKTNPDRAITATSGRKKKDRGAKRKERAANKLLESPVKDRL